MSYEIDSDLPVNNKNNYQNPETSPVNHEPEMQSHFNDDTMNDIFYGGAERQTLLDEVIHLCQFGNNLVALVGDQGVGKTVFLKQSNNELSNSSFCCFIEADRQMTPEDIFSEIVSQLDLPINPDASAGEMIAVLRRGIAEGEVNRVVFIIDDAHELNDTILSALISLLQGNHSQHLHILLAGEKALVNRLDQFDMVDVMVYDVTLNPLSLQETEDYLNFRFKNEDYSDQSVFDTETVSSIWKESGGVLGSVNSLFDKYLAEQVDDFDVPEELSPTRGLPFIHIGLLVLLIAALLLALVYMGGSEGDESNVIQLPISTEQDVDASTVDDSNNEVVSPAVVDEITPTDKEKNIQIAFEPVPKDPAVNELQNKIAIKSNANKNALETVNPDPSLGSNTSIQQGVATPLSKSEDFTSEDSIAKAEETTALPDQVSKSSVADNVIQANDAKWLSALGADSYVLQVLGASMKSSVQKFIDAQPNKSELRLIELIRNGQPWYVVVVGNYKNNELARKAIQFLPQKQVNSGPWPRKVSDLKREMAAYRNR